jgi:thiosulfate/3-mercaptopyruvate sulfurtransferase
MKPFVSAQWLAHNRDDVVLVDVRWYMDGRSGLDAFTVAHAPGATYIDLDTWLAGPASPAEGRHPLPTPDVFAEGMARHGIGDDSVVVAYDDAGGVIAARLVWMLRAVGIPAAVLDGGLSVFSETIESGSAAACVRAHFTAREWPRDQLATIEDAASAKHVIDARNRDRFEGAPDALDPRSGHIPGAHNVPCRENLDGGFLKSGDAVRAAFSSAGLCAGDEFIAYCGSGVTACHNLLTWEWLGEGRARLFPGSWSQYSHDAARPVATGRADAF